MQKEVLDKLKRLTKEDLKGIHVLSLGEGFRVYRLLEEVVEASTLLELEDTRPTKIEVQVESDSIKWDVLEKGNEALKKLIKSRLLFTVFLIDLYHQGKEGKRKVNELLEIVFPKDNSKKTQIITFLDSKGITNPAGVKVFDEFINQIKKEVGKGWPKKAKRGSPIRQKQYQLIKWYWRVRGVDLLIEHNSRLGGKKPEDRVYQLIIKRKITEVNKLLESRDRGKPVPAPTINAIFSDSNLQESLKEWLKRSKKEILFLSTERDTSKEERLLNSLEKKVRQINPEVFDEETKENLEGITKRITELKDQFEDDKTTIKLVESITKEIKPEKEIKMEGKTIDWGLNEWLAKYHRALDLERFINALGRVDKFLSQVNVYQKDIDKYLQASEKDKKRLLQSFISLLSDLSLATNLLELMALDSIKRTKITYQEFFNYTREKQLAFLEDNKIISKDVARWFLDVFDLEQEIEEKFTGLVEQMPGKGKTGKDIFEEVWKKWGKDKGVDMSDFTETLGDFEDLLTRRDKVTPDDLRRIASRYEGGIFDWESKQKEELRNLFGEAGEAEFLDLKKRESSLSEEEKDKLSKYYDKLRSRMYQILNDQILGVNQEYGSQTVLEPTIRIIALLALLPRAERSNFYGFLFASKFDIARLQIKDISYQPFDHIKINGLQGLKFEVRGKDGEIKSLTVFDFLDIWEEPASKYFVDPKTRDKLRDPRKWESWVVQYALALTEGERQDIEEAVMKQAVKKQLGIEYDNLSDEDKSKIKILMLASLGVANATFRAAFIHTGADMKETGLLKGVLGASLAAELYINMYGGMGLSQEIITTLSDVLSRTRKGRLPVFEYVANEVFGDKEDKKEILKNGMKVLFLLPMNNGLRRIGEVHLLARNKELREELFSHPLVAEMIALIDETPKLKEKLIKVFELKDSDANDLEADNVSASEILTKIMEKWSYHYLLKDENNKEKSFLPIKAADYGDYIKYAQAFDAVKGDLFNFAYRPTKPLLIKIYTTLANTSAGPEFAKTFMKPLISDYIDFYKPRGLTKPILSLPFLPLKMISNLLSGKKVLSREDYLDLFQVKVKNPSKRMMGAEAGGEIAHYDLVRGRWVFEKKPVLQLWREKFHRQAVGEYGEMTEEGQGIGEKAVSKVDVLRHLWLMAKGEASIATLLGLDDAVIKRKDLVDDLVEFRNMHIIDAPLFYSLIREKFGLWFYLQYRFHLGGLEFGTLLDFVGSGVGAIFS